MGISMLTYTDLYNLFLQNINAVGNTDTNILNAFNSYLGLRYQLILAKLRNYKTTAEYTFSTTASTQYYPYPVNEITIEGMYITVGSVNFPLRIINSRMDWEQLNAILIQASALPQFYFPRANDFGIWPIPQAVYSGNISYHYRDRNLSIADYLTGTVTLTLNSSVVTGVGTTFTPAMVGRWLSVTDPTAPGQGTWYQISSYTNATTLGLFRPWVNATVTTSSGGYRIGEVPLIPDELHVTLVDGVTADFYAGMRKDLKSAQMYENRFWTGDVGNPLRKEGDSTIAGGLIGGVNRYADRDDTRIIKRKPKLNPLQYKVWATTLS